MARREHRHGVALDEFAAQHHVVIDGVDRRFVRPRGQLDAATRAQHDVQIQRFGKRHHGRLLVVGRADEHSHLRIVDTQFRNARSRIVGEGRLDLLLRLRQCGPQLNPVVHISRVRQMLRSALRMHDAAARRHPVDGTGLDQLFAAQTVAVHHRALEQIGHRGQADMRMRAHVDLRFRLDRNRAEMIEEHERPHRPALQRRQHAAHHEAAAQILHVALQTQGHRSVHHHGDTSLRTRHARPRSRSRWSPWS